MRGAADLGAVQRAARAPLPLAHLPRRYPGLASRLDSISGTHNPRIEFYPRGCIMGDSFQTYSILEIKPNVDPKVFM